MKRFLKPSELPVLILCSAALTFIARALLFVSAIGGVGRGLLRTGSLPDIASWFLVAVTLGLLLVGTWKMRDPVKYSRQSRSALLATIAMSIAAVSFCFTSLRGLLSATDTVGLISASLGLLAAASLGLLAWGRMRGKQLNMVFHGIVCLYLMLHLVSHYRLWSSSPQLQSYAFELLAIVFVMLACYHRAAADAGHGICRSHTLCSLAAVYFCIAALPGCDNPIFFIGSAIWIFCTPCRLSSSRQRS